MADDFDEWSVFRRLDRKHAGFAKAMWSAWDRWTGGLISQFPVSPTRVRRTVVQDLFVQEIRKLFAADNDVRLLDGGDDRFLMFVPPAEGVKKFLVQFKHVDDRLRPSNYPTVRAKRFVQQMPLDGIPVGMRLTLGFRLNKAETDVAGLYLIYLVGHKVVWSYEINRPGSASIAVFPPQQPLFPPDRTTGRVTAKRDPAEMERKQANRGRHLRVVDKQPTKPKQT